MAFNYHCFNTEHRAACELCSKNGQVLLGEEGSFVCPNNETDLKLIGEINGSAAIKTPTGNRFSLEQRKKRNKEHFIKTDLPNISDKDAKRHHLSKLGYKVK